MLITSLSVPGSHLDCKPPDNTFDDAGSSLFDMLYHRLSRAYFIWSGLGMSIQGVRTCGDYMFSGHTVALTLLNFFVTECKSKVIFVSDETKFISKFYFFSRYSAKSVLPAYNNLAVEYVWHFLYLGRS